jgi:hypothetical protein
MYFAELALGIKESEISYCFKQMDALRASLVKNIVNELALGVSIN